MAYLGKYETRVADFKVYTSSTATATHTLSWTPTSKQSLRITINGVVQQDDAFSLTGNTVTLDAAILVTDVLEIVGVNELGGQVLVPADGSIQTGKLGSNAVTTAKIQDDAVTLAKMAGGTDGNLITYDASGDPAHVATGSATHVLTSNGAGAAPTFQAAAAGGKVLQVVSNTWKTTSSTTSSTMSLVTDSGTTITPSAVSSKILITGYVSCDVSGSNHIGFKLYDGASEITGPTGSAGSGTNEMVAGNGGNYAVAGIMALPFTFLYSPSTTSATTINLYFEGGTTSYVNRNHGNTTEGYSSNITLMEIGA
jgi:hypothetical protein